MKWATRKNLGVDRVASVWLIRKYIDPNAEIEFVADSSISRLTDEGVLTFDAEHAKYRHDDDEVLGKYGDKCTFQVLLDEYDLAGKDPALDFMGEILYAADIGHRRNIYSPLAGYGLWCLARGFVLTTPDDEEKLVRELPVYDALFAYCQEELRRSPASRYSDKENLAFDAKVEVKGAGGDVSSTFPDSLRDRLPQLSAAISQTLDRLQEDLGRFRASAESVAKGINLSGLEVKFGVSFELEAGVIIGKTKGGATFEVTISLE
jgi:hypothetical protein